MEILARTCGVDQLNVYRVAARLFVFGGGVVWAAVVFGADYAYEGQSTIETVGSAVVPLAIAFGALVLSLIYETLTGLLLLGASVAFVIFGMASSWTGEEWLTMALVIIAPLLIAGVLFLLSARMQRICTLGAT